MLKKILLGLAGLVAVLVLVVLVIGLIRPSRFRVERAIDISAPPERIYPWIASFKNGWSAWSDFQKEDPEMTLTYSGPDEGVGATESWQSRHMGDGYMKILRGDPTHGVDYELSMANGFSLEGKIATAAQGANTRVTWSDTIDMGGNPFKRAMGLLIENGMGKTFEQSLATLKQKVESGAAPKK